MLPSRVLSIPFMLGALGCLFLAWEVHEKYAIYVVPNVIVLAILYIFSPQINWWWYKRFPPRLDPKLGFLLEKQLAFYQQLTPENKKRFRERIFLFILANDFMPQAMENVPEDIKAIVAASAVQLSFGQEEFVFSKFERVVIYPKAFPSPQYPRMFHSSEIYEEDGVVLFSAEHLMRSFMQPAQYYNVGLHEYAKVFRAQYPEIDFPVLSEDIWKKMQEISGFSREAITKWINLEVIEVFPVSVAHFFAFPKKFQAILPDLYRRYSEIFNQDPAG